MPTIKVTDELISIIKSERKDKNIKSAELASKLKKNTSFISKLERGDIAEIDLKTFFKIFDTLIPDDNKRSEFVNDLLKKYTIKLNKDEIDKQKWMTVFDLQYRLIKIPEGVINALQTEIETLNAKGFSTRELINKINENDELINKSEYEDNKLNVYVNESGKISFSIKLNLEENFIDRIINGDQSKINYITILGIFHNLYKIQGFSKEDAYIKAGKLLYDNKFYTLLERDRFINDNNFDNLSKEDREFKKLSKELVTFLDFLGDEDADFINEKLKVFIDNLNKNLSLTIAIIGVSLDTLKELPFEKKKQFKEEYISLINKFESEKDSKVIERI